MSLLLKIPSKTQAYLFAKRDLAQDKFDVTKFRFGYENIIDIPLPWAYYKFESDGNDYSGNGHHLSQDNLWPEVELTSPAYGGSMGGGGSEEYPVTQVVVDWLEMEGVDDWGMVPPYTFLQDPIAGTHAEVSSPNTTSGDIDVLGKFTAVSIDLLSEYLNKNRYWVKFWVINTPPMPDPEEASYVDVFTIFSHPDAYNNYLTFGNPGPTGQRFKSFTSALLRIDVSSWAGGSVSWTQGIVFKGPQAYEWEYHGDYPSYSSGVVGNGVLFDSDLPSEKPNNTYAELLYTEDVPPINNGNFTCAFWFYGEGSEYASILCGFECDLESTGGDYDISIYTDYQFIYAPGAITPNTWHFICFYFDGTGLYLEIDNIPIASDIEDIEGSVEEGSYQTHVGWPYNGKFKVDELRIYLAALTVEQRTQLYNAR
jgi:hypothetical protein